jgi:xylose isomerase
MKITFPQINQIAYEGPESKNPPAFKHYNADETVNGKTMREHLRIAKFVTQRYASWDFGVGAKIESGKTSLKELETYILKKGESSTNTSGRQEFLENLINEFI